MNRLTDMLGGGKMVGFKVPLAHACGGAVPGLLLSQFWYWSNNTASIDRDGWFYKTQEEITEETGITRTELETCRKRLVALGVIEEKRKGVPAKMWYRMRKEVLEEVLEAYFVKHEIELQKRSDKKLQQGMKRPAIKFAGKPQTGLQESRKQERPLPANSGARKPQTITETTLKKTQKNTHNPEVSTSSSSFPDWKELSEPEKTPYREAVLKSSVLLRQLADGPQRDRNIDRAAKTLYETEASSND